MILSIAGLLALAPAASEQAPGPRYERLACVQLVTEFRPLLRASGRVRHEPRFRLEALDERPLAISGELPWALWLELPEPALLLSRARPDAGVDVLLARCLDGRLELRTLGTLAYAMLLADWLDGPAASQRGGSDWALAHGAHPGIGPGGSLLFVDGLGVLDTRDWRLLAPRDPAGFQALSSRRPLGAAPDRQRYARLGVDGRGHLVLGVVSLDRRPGELVRIPKAARLSPDPTTVPADWFAAHFEWSQGPGGSHLHARR